MAVYIGGTEIGSVYIGSTKADAVYIGETKVWPTLPPWWPDEWEYINSTGNFESVEQARAAADRRGIDYETVTTLDFGFDLSGSTDAAGLVGLWAGLERVAIRGTSNVTNTQQMFHFCSSIVEVPLFDTSNVTNMVSMFNTCSSIVEVPLFDTSSVTDMRLMFYSCSSLKAVEFTDCSKVTNVNDMLGECTSLERLILPGLSVGIDLTDTALGATALNDFFDALGQANGTQEIDITGTPGASSCDPTIAENKGFTVIR